MISAQNNNTITQNIETGAIIETECNGVPVYSFSNIVYVYGESPDLNPNAVIQTGNDNPVSKIKLKKSNEIKHNFAGSEHGMTVRTPYNDTQPMLPIHLIDGNPDTIWCSWGSYAPDERPEWIRIDLPVESVVNAVVVKCNMNYMNRDWYYGRALPCELEIKLSCDARQWDTVYVNNDVDLDAQEIIASFEPKGAKQIRITGRIFKRLTQHAQNAFSIGGVEVKDPDGNDLALVSRGAGVTVSSVNFGVYNDRYTQDALWGPLQYDLGNKWTRTGGDNGMCIWTYTEHEKGKLTVDSRFDESVTEAVQNGVNFILVLDFKGNWIYADPPRKDSWSEARYKELNDMYADRMPKAPDSPEMFEAFLRYAEYMARHFGDRVSYFELGNEWESNPVDWYINKFFKPTYDVIKKANPEAKICMGAIAEEYPSYRPVNCLGPGARILDGMFISPGRTMLVLKNVYETDVEITVDAVSEAQTGVVLRYTSQSSYLLAIYDRQNSLVYFAENDWSHPFYIQEYEKLSATSAEGFGEKISLKASVSDDMAYLSLSDGTKAVSASHKIIKTPGGGRIGVICSPCRPQSFTLESKLDCFHAVSGTKTVKADFGTKEDWEILWNYWGDGTPIAPLIDAVAWHPARRDMLCPADGTHMNEEYFNHLRAFQKDCESLGFTGGYFANEVYTGAIYPASELYKGRTDFMMAKYLLRCLVGHSALNAESAPCHPHYTGFPHPQALCRAPVPTQTITPCQPTPSYYTWRNAASALDDFYMADFPVELSNSDDVLYFPLKNSDMTCLMLAIWLDVPLADEFSKKTLDIAVSVTISEKVSAVDLFNGTEQALDFEVNENRILLKGIIVKDYPMLIRFHLHS